MGQLSSCPTLIFRMPGASSNVTHGLSGPLAKARMWLSLRGSLIIGKPAFRMPPQTA